MYLIKKSISLFALLFWGIGLFVIKHLNAWLNSFSCFRVNATFSFVSMFLRNVTISNCSGQYLFKNVIGTPMTPI